MRSSGSPVEAEEEEADEEDEEEDEDDEGAEAEGRAKGVEGAEERDTPPPKKLFCRSAMLPTASDGDRWPEDARERAAASRRRWFSKKSSSSARTGRAWCDRSSAFTPMI